MHTLIRVILMLLMRMIAEELTYHGHGMEQRTRYKPMILGEITLLHLILRWEMLTIMWLLIEITKILTPYIFITKLQLDLLQNGPGVVVQTFSLVHLLFMHQHLQKRLVAVKTGLRQMIIWQVCTMYMEHLMMKLMHGMLSLHQ